MNTKLISTLSSLILAGSCGNLVSDQPPVGNKTEVHHLANVELSVDLFDSKWSNVWMHKGSELIQISIELTDNSNIKQLEFTNKSNDFDELLKKDPDSWINGSDREIAHWLMHGDYVPKARWDKDPNYNDQWVNYATPPAYRFLKEHLTNYVRDWRAEYEITLIWDHIWGIRPNLISLSYKTTLPDGSQTPPPNPNKDSTQFYTSIPNEENSYVRMQMLYINRKYCDDGYEKPSNCSELDNRFYQHYVLFPNVTTSLPNNWKRWYKLDNYIVLAKDVPPVDNNVPLTADLFNYWKSNWNKFFSLVLYEYIPSIQPKYPIYYIQDFKSTIPREESKEPEDKPPLVDSPKTLWSKSILWIQENPWIFYPIVGTLLSILTGSLVRLILLPINQWKDRKKILKNQNDRNGK